MIFLLALWSGLPELGAGQWVERPGEGWADLTLYHHDTQQQYGREGERGDIPNAGHAVATSAFLTGAVGLVRGVDAWIQVPVHRLRYDDFAGTRESLGFGDPRVYLRASPELFGIPAVPVALRAGVKWPGGDFDVDAEVIPLGEGQRDVELLLEVGRSFHPWPLWTMGWIGHQWRAPNVTAARDPGNELFGYWAVGGSLGRLGWKGAFEGTRGRPVADPEHLDSHDASRAHPGAPHGRLAGGARAPRRRNPGSVPGTQHACGLGRFGSLLRPLGRARLTGPPGGFPQVSHRASGASTTRSTSSSSVRTPRR